MAKSSHVPLEGPNPVNHQPPLKQPPEKVVQVISPPMSEPTSEPHNTVVEGMEQQVKVNAMLQLLYEAELLS